jgi:hypothetical protein
LLNYFFSFPSKWIWFEPKILHIYRTLPCS